MIKPDTKYAGKIGAGSQVIETQSGALGFQVQLECADGPTSFIIWLTEKNRLNAEKYFEILGADPKKLKQPAYIEHELPTFIAGREVSFGTKEEEFQGRKTVKVAWIGRKSEGNPSRAAAKFFGAKEEELPFVATDDDVGF